ncbi:MAG TPA: transaldolase [Candidatus Deferrimicrobiaceae bacterium]|jgi:transaldolase/glucose-6-phosphate isomerase
MAKNNPMVLLSGAGQSPWLDYISRDLLTSGGLAKMIADDGIKGVTTNPTIFEKAISAGHAYDPQLKDQAAKGATPLAAFTAMATDDVRAAADLLAGVYNETGGADGYVSIEVEPDLANDTAATVSRAVELYALVNRPNVLVKIPATKEGLPAIEEAISLSVPVNVTLIFSVRRYEEVAAAYIRGVERLIEGGGEARSVASVASFFVSRVDTAVDKQLSELAHRWPGSPKAETAHDLMGAIAVANARIAFGRSLAIFGTPRWQALAAKGARVQRPLWASTGTKDPAYSDVKYIEELIGPGTVNTMPPATIDAFRDHGNVADALTGSVEAAHAVLEDLGLLGIGIEEVCAQLEKEGVASFTASYRTLLAAIGKRMAEG